MNALITWSPRQKKMATAIGGCLLLFAAVSITMPRYEMSEKRARELTWQSEKMEVSPSNRRADGVAGGVPGGVADKTIGAVTVHEDTVIPDRQVIRTASLQLFSNDPAQSAARAEQLAQSLGGFVISSAVSGSAHDEQSANLELRVPERRMNDARQELRKLGTRVQQESTAARDVTRDYIDQQSELRNLRAEEQQYLSILKRASQVKDITAVTEKLGEVRGRTDRLQAESRYLAEQVQMAELTVQILPEVKAAGLNWQPLNSARLAMRSALDGLSDWLDDIIAIVLHVPVVLLWVATLALLAKIAWILLRTAMRTFFPRAAWLAPKPQAS